MSLIKQAVILAGGLGTRMRPLTSTMPKPMIPIHGKPFLSYIIELLKKNDIIEIIILVGYLHEKIEQHFGNGERFGIKISYSYSPVDADTGTRLKNALPLFDQKILLLYGDNYWPLKLTELTDFYKKMHTKASIVVYSNLDSTTRNNVRLASNSIVEAYDRTRKRSDLTGVDIGFFIFDKSVFRTLPEEDFSFEDLILPRLIAKKQLAGFVTHHKYYGLSIHERIPIIEDYFRPKKVVFLDRDGVINKKPPKAEYIRTWKQFIFLPKVKDALKLLQKKRYEIYIISSQAGIARGKITRKAVDLINNRFINEMGRIGVRISDIYICPHGWGEGCFCRKPAPGLFFQAASKYHINLFDSYCIGDDPRDIIAGRLAGCKTIFTGDTQMGKFSSSERPNFICKDLYEAVKYL